jgi:glutamate synthase (NADPH/NADH) large chain
VRQPILTNEDLEKIRSIHDVLDGGNPFQVAHARHHLAMPASRARRRHGAGARRSLRARRATRCASGINIIILSDRAVGPDRIPIPALLACAAVHHHLIRTGLRTSVGLVVEPASRARCITSRASPATAPRRSIPISRSRRSSR